MRSLQDMSRVGRVSDYREPLQGKMPLKGQLKYIALAFLFALVLVPVAYGEDISVTARLDRNRISLQDEAILTISVSGTSSSSLPELPNLPDFDVTARGRSSRIRITNGVMSPQIDYNFALLPHKIGDFTIGPATVQYKGKTYRSEPLNLHVTKDTALETGGRDTFVTTEVGRASPYVGEQLIFRLKFFHRIGITNASLEEISCEGFQVKDIKNVTYNTVLDGVRYQVTEICKLLIPSEAGNITIPGAVLRCEVPAGRRQQNQDPFFGDDFFYFHRTEPRILRSRPLTLHVRSLPQKGKPSPFSGLVGSFTLSTELNKNEIKEGESVTMTITVTGKGDLSFVTRPLIQGIEQFKAYDDHPVTSEKFVDNQMVSVKVFKTALVPLKAGDLAIPEVSIVFFDPETGTYRKASTAPLRLRVLPGSGQDTPFVVASGESSAPKQRVQVVGRDILPIHTDIYPLTDETFHLLTWPTFTALLVPPLLYLGILVLKRKREKFAMDIDFARSTAAMKQAKKGIKEAELLAKDSDPKPCYAHLSKTLKIYLGNKMNFTGEANTSDELQAAIQKRINEGPLVEQTATLFKKLELRQFAPGMCGSEAPRNLVQETRCLIEQMEKVL